MKLRTFLVSTAAAACLLALPAAGAAQCDPDGDVQFVCGPGNPEDLAAVPESPWVIVSSMAADGGLYATDSRDHTSRPIFPLETSAPRHDAATYGSCPGPDTSGFQPHGLGLRPGADGVHTLYVVRHGDREAIEVFEVDAGGASPAVTWVGCAIAPEGVRLNSVAALPDGAFVATHFRPDGGELWEWQPGGGWSQVPGSEMAGPNGIEASADGRWFYIGGWGTQSLIRLSRGRTPIESDSVDVGFHIDNVHYAPDGSLLAAGHAGNGPDSIFACIREGDCDGVTSRVARVDPDSLAAQEVVHYPSNDLVIVGTVGIEVGDEIWVGGIGGGQRIARFPASR
jgi:hypothetical protein